MQVDNANAVTFEFLKKLGDHTGYTDHIGFFKELFDVYKPNSFLEWGCGYSSKYFLDNCKKVTSIELICNGMSTEWFDHCRDLFKDIKNWNPILLAGSNAFQKACAYQNSIHKDYSLIDCTYVEELKNYIQIFNNQGKYDVAFVDPVVYVRGDIANLCLQEKIPIVIIHDARSLFLNYPSLEIDYSADTGLYGWFKIQKYDDYDKLFYDYGQGTMVWINKSHRRVYDDLKDKLSLFVID